MSSPIRILLVEDSPEDAELVIHELRRAGIEFEWRRVEDEAEYRLNLGSPPDVVVSDYSLPQFGAPRALEILDDLGLDVPFIVVSGNVGEQTAVEMMKRGARDYLLKDRMARLGQAVQQAVEEKRLRDQKRRAESEAAESEHRFRRIFENSLDAITITSLANRRFIEVNEELLRLTGFNREQVIGSTADDLDVWVDRAERGEILREVAAKGFVRDRDVEFRLKSGAIINALYSAVRLDVGGEPCLLSIVRDVTERVRAERDLELALERAQESDRLKSAFLANMSHEVRTPLNVIVGYNALFADELEALGAESLGPMLEAVARATKRLVSTMHSILELSRMDAGAFEVRPAALAVAEIVERVARDFEPVAREKGLDFRRQIDEPEATVVFDEYSLVQALSRLVDNAVKFTETGEVSLRLFRDAGGVLSLAIRDTGVGIDAPYLSRLFDAFSQEQSGYTRRFEGLGLGLALAKRYVESSGGALSVESSKGSGSTFTIEFRVGVAAEGGGTGGKSNGTRPAGECPEILIVDQDAETRQTLNHLLTGRYRVVAAASAREARERLTVRPDVRLILTEIVLGQGENGIQLARHLRQRNRWRDVPIIAVTGRWGREDLIRAGFDDLLAKPLDATGLLSRIERWIGRAAERNRPRGGPPLT